MFLPISNVAHPIESLFPTICYLLINNHPVSRRPYMLALATSIVREDFSQATRPCLCPSTWVSASTGTLSILFPVIHRMNPDFGMKLLFVSLQTYCQWISVLSMGPATFLLHRPLSPSSIAAVQPPAPAAVSIGFLLQHFGLDDSI